MTTFTRPSPETMVRFIADSVKKNVCAYYDPYRVAFGKASRCVNCCINENSRGYDPACLDRECKRSSIVNGMLPTVDQALARGM